MMVVLFFILKAPPPKNANLTFKERVAQLDILGTSIFVPCMVCLLLALQWGGSTYQWSNGRNHRSTRVVRRPPDRLCRCPGMEEGWHTPSSHHQAAKHCSRFALHDLCGCDYAVDGLLPSTLVPSHQGTPPTTLKPFPFGTHQL